MNLPRRAGLLVLLFSAAVVATVMVLPPFAQPLAYHRFADQRAVFGVPNFLNVVSNAPFLLVAVLGLAALGRAVCVGRLAYAAFFIALAATALGSAWYHLAPDNASLFWDRLPMSVAFGALLAAVVSERPGVRVGQALFAPLLLAGPATVLYWRVSASLGAENVLPYFAWQGYAIVAIVLLLLLFPSRYSHTGMLLRAAVLYAVALCAEWFDPLIFALGEVISGHSVKHLLAALAAYQVVRMLRARTPV